MKLKLYIIINIIFINRLFCQYDPERADKPELFFLAYGIPSSTTVTYTLQKLTKTYTHDSFYDDWEECSNCDELADLKFTGPDATYSKGWNISYDEHSGDTLPTYGYGLYRFYTSLTNKYSFFYLDIRDNNYSQNYTKGTTDFNIDYTYSTDRFRYKRSGEDSPDWEDITSGSLVTIWDIFESTAAIKTSDFPSTYWQNCLGIGKLFGWDPYLIWSRHPSFSSVDDYYIYVGTPSNGIAPADNTYDQLTSTNSTIYNYVDDDVPSSIDFPEYADPYIRLYYVKAKKGSLFSDRSNIEAVFSNVSWSNALVLSVNHNDNPVLHWAKYEGFTVKNYKIYRATRSTPVGNPLQLNWSLIETTNAQTDKYVDYDLQITSGGTYIYYQVKAYRNGQYSSATNRVDARGIFYKRSESSKQSTDIKFCLEDNYPNPFNPSTTITYQLPIKGQVVLKIFDTLGEEVAVLENEFKEKGIYATTFNAENLPSGMYFYHLRAGDYSETKKMILMK